MAEKEYHKFGSYPSLPKPQNFNQYSQSNNLQNKESRVPYQQNPNYQQQYPLPQYIYMNPQNQIPQMLPQNYSYGQPLLMIPPVRPQNNYGLNLYRSSLKVLTFSLVIALIYQFMIVILWETYGYDLYSHPKKVNIVLFCVISDLYFIFFATFCFKISEMKKNWCKGGLILIILSVGWLIFICVTTLKKTIGHNNIYNCWFMFVLAAIFLRGLILILSISYTKKRLQ